MEPQPGQEVERSIFPKWAMTLGGLAGFSLLAGLSVAILAAVVLLPEYARWRQELYERDIQAALTADLQCLAESHERLLAAMKLDPVLTKRLAITSCGLLPNNETVISATHPAPAPGLIEPVINPRPKEPDNVLTRAAATLADPATRRGLCLLSAALMLAAMFLFPPPVCLSKASRT